MNHLTLLHKLLEERESEWLDFKSEWHYTNCALIHDILCLANSDVDGARFLVIGVTDDGKVIGVAANENRKSQAMLYDLIGNSNFNVIPSIRVHSVTLETGENVDIIEIEDKPEKPYFLLKDKVCKLRVTSNSDELATMKSPKEKSVRAGVVYSRLADRNTPIDSCVDDKKLERMFLERFALNLTPSERFRRYICNPERWNKGEIIASYYQEFPEFTIEEVPREGELEKYDEPWVRTFPDSKGFRYQYNAKYHGTTLEQVYVVSCDGGRVQYAQPNLKYGEDDKYYYWFYYFVIGSHLYNLHLFFHGDPTDFRAFRDPIALVESEHEVDQRIQEGKNGQSGQGLYLLEKDSREWFYAGPKGDLLRVSVT